MAHGKPRTGKEIGGIHHRATGLRRVEVKRDREGVQFHLDPDGLEWVEVFGHREGVAEYLDPSVETA
ncbi:hypothetical protein [Phycicoccus jejuensis]|uniref:hypothetical protein n=1 Tax=Phycicoccus jejuensis TaxID=367299 RepID=UPI0004C45CFA|nr:hypothetical protein [Phycicoccus jejuensis]